jgi:hypothetical protein
VRNVSSVVSLWTKTLRGCVHLAPPGQPGAKGCVPIFLNEHYARPFERAAPFVLRQYPRVGHAVEIASAGMPAGGRWRGREAFGIAVEREMQSTNICFYRRERHSTPFGAGALRGPAAFELGCAPCLSGR